MSRVNRLAFIGNALPRRCGIATFTSDLHRAVTAARPGLAAGIVAMNDHGHRYGYAADVAHQIAEERVEDYIGVAEALNSASIDIVCLQHEFGIFGGDAGDHVNRLLERLRMPVVTTLHTVLADPNAAQRAALEQVIGASAKLVVMAEKGRELLHSVHGVATDRIEVIPHGIPEMPFVEPDDAKRRLGFDGKSVILTFGLLSPGKGIEVVIDAMPGILRRCPDAIYVVLGATHPNLVRQYGEAYRESLAARAAALGVEDHVVLLDRFVDLPSLLTFIAMCDVYVTPYLGAEQMTSGTLAYSYGLGKAVVSTPYWHAQELLGGGGGVLVPFNDPAATGDAVAELLTDDERRLAMRRDAYAQSRTMTWPRTAERYLDLFDRVLRDHRVTRQARSVHPVVAQRVLALPPMRTDHLVALSDDTGLLQHAVHTVADRSHGYCLDDNARALLTACMLNDSGERPLPEPLPARFAAFVQHAWNPSLGRFRNFMGFDRRWLEDCGSEDSHGRALWALGEAACSDSCPSRRSWAAELFSKALPATEAFTSPRAWAFALLGLERFDRAVQETELTVRPRLVLADRLAELLARVANDEWFWFEEGLAYDNARLSQALILAGSSLRNAAHVANGLRSLRWLMAVQTGPSGVFRPVGTSSFGELRRRPGAFDQQPLEAAATIAACLSAWRASGDAYWPMAAENAFAWFMGRNDLAVPLVDPAKGSCRDGLHADRPNENCGAESVLAYLAGLADMRALRRATSAPALSAPPALSA